MAHLDRASQTADTVARNDAVFRDANERTDAFVESVEGMGEGPLPFLCECADVTCTEIIKLTRTEYEALRLDAVRFATVSGHEGDNDDWASIPAAIARAADPSA